MSILAQHRSRVAGCRSRWAVWPRVMALALGVAGALAGQGSPAFADQVELGQLRVGSSPAHPGAIVLSWSGRIAAPMASQIKDAFEQRKYTATKVVLRLTSGGGSVDEGERVIKVLRDIKTSHQLQTVVNHGQMCGSMCVFIYAQGEKRTAALSSTWLFHEVSRADPATKKIAVLDRPRWEYLVDTYLRPAGVTAEWIAKMKPYTVKSDYWQTGADLVNENSGLIHESLSNQQARIVDQDDRPAPNAAAPQRTGAPTARSDSQCRVYIASIGAVVPVRCD